MTIDELNVIITAQNQEFNRKINDVNERVSDFASRTAKSGEKISGIFAKVGSTISKAFAAAGITAFTKQALEMASGLQEVQNVVDVSFGDMAYKAEAFADTAIESFGLSELAAKKTSSTYMAMAKGIGIADDVASDMAISLTQLSADVASFYNISQELADIKLRSVFTGETETLKDLGVVMTQANLQQFAYSQGIQKTIDKMTQAERVILQYKFVTQQLSLAQGDFTRTSGSWANQVRVLSERWKEFMSIVGNGLIQVLTPAIQFLNNVLSELIILAKAVSQVLSEVFGIGGGSASTSGKTAMSSVANDTYSAANAQQQLATETEAAGEAAKKSVLGFDELNVLASQKNASSSAPNSSSDLGGVGDIDFGTPNTSGVDSAIDQVDAKVQKLAEKIKKSIEGIANVLKKISPLLKGVTAGFLAFKGMKLLKSLTSGSKLLKKLTPVLKTFWSGLKSGKGILTSLKGGWNGLKSSMSNMSTFKKAAISVAGLATEAVTTYSAVKDLALGNIDLDDALLNILPTFGLVTTALYLMWGPAGLVAGVIVGLASAISGYASAQKEIMDNLVNEAFYSGVGTTITEISDKFEAFTQQIIDSNQPILDNQANIDAARDSIDQTANSLLSVEKGISLGLYTAEEKMPEITALFEQLKTDTKTIMDSVYDNVVMALAGSLGDALEAAGMPMDDYVAMLSLLKGEADATYTNLVDKQNDLKISYENGSISFEEFKTGLSEIMDGMKNLTGQTDLVTSFADETARLFEDIDWEDEDAKNNAFTKLAENGESAKTSINETCDAIKSDLETMKGWSDNEEYQLMLDQMLLGNEESREKQLAAIDTELNSIFDMLQTDLIQKSSAVKEAAVTEWNNMDWFAKWWNGGSEEAYVNKALENYQNNIVNPVTTKIQETMDSIGTNGSVWAEDAMTAVLNSLFDTETIHSDFTGGGLVYKYRSSIEYAINNALKAAGKSGKETAKEEGKNVMSGTKDGIDSNVSLVTSSIRFAGNQTIQAWKDAVESHSPSKVFTNEGRYVMQGLQNGIDENAWAVDSSFKSMLNTLLGRMETFTNRCRSALNSMLSDFARSMQSVSVSNSGKVSYQSTRDVYIPRLAKGGVAYQETLAMIGEGKDREAVLPLNSQVYREIASGINSERGGQDNRILDRLARIEQAIKDYSGGDIYLDREKIGEKMDRRSAAKSRRYGQPVNA